MTFYLLGKLAANYIRDLTLYEKEISIKATFVFDGDKCTSNALDFSLKFKGKERNVRNKNVEYNPQPFAHNGSGFDTWIEKRNLPCDKHLVDNIKIGKSVLSSRVSFGYIHKNENKFLNI